MKQPQVTILIPNYRTPLLTKLCLRLIRKLTPAGLAEVIVIDNQSEDESVTYLRSLSWIKLIERKAVPNEGAISAHSRALDLGLEQVNTPYVLSIHTDTLIKHPEWLVFLLSHFENRPMLAGVGSWKLETKPFWRQVLKSVERKVQLAYYRLLAKSPKSIEGAGKNYYYLRSHCAIYRMDLIRKLNLRFTGQDMIAGKEMHKHFIDAGYDMKFLSSEELIPYLEHLNHATTVLNPELRVRTNSVSKGLRRINKSLARMNPEQILAEEGLDR